MPRLRAKKWIKNWEELRAYTELFRQRDCWDFVYYDTPMWDSGYLSDCWDMQTSFAVGFDFGKGIVVCTHLYFSEDRCLLRMHLNTSQYVYSQTLLLDYDFTGGVVDCVKLIDKRVCLAKRLTLRGAMKVLCDTWFWYMERRDSKKGYGHVVQDTYGLSVLLEYMDYDLGGDLGTEERPILSFDDRLDDADIIGTFL